MRAFSIFVLSVVAGTILVAARPPADATEISGRVRIVDMNDRRVEGEVEELSDAYRVSMSNGITVTIKKNMVKEIVKLEDESPAVGRNEALDRVWRANRVSDEVVEAILGDDWIESSDILSASALAGEALNVDGPSVEEMLKIAGEGGGSLTTDHFVLIYTSDKALALKLASRLESTYGWVLKYMDMLGIDAVAPENKLEIYFFSDHQQYKSYGSTVGGIPDWAAGFYMRTNNRSAFYDMNFEPRLVRLREQLENAPWRQRQFIQNRMKRAMDFFNLTVIQHEAAHHIHFNVGVFPKRGDVSTWVVEGLAQMFELPPGSLGGGLGATNHFRLSEFNGLYNKRYGGNPKAIVPVRLFISDDSQWNPARDYPYGWALNHFLWRKHRDQYAVFMQRMSKREEDKELTVTEKQQEFEDIFGPADEKFQESFLSYIFSIQPRWTPLDL